MAEISLGFPRILAIHGIVGTLAHRSNVSIGRVPRTFSIGDRIMITHKNGLSEITPDKRFFRDEAFEYNAAVWSLDGPPAQFVVEVRWKSRTSSDAERVAKKNYPFPAHVAVPSTDSIRDLQYRLLESIEASFPTAKLLPTKSPPIR